jgi:hypothetical protein
MNSMSEANSLVRQVRQHSNNLPTGKEGQGGNFRGAFRRVRLVIEQAGQEEKKSGVSNHSYGG